MRPLRPRFVLRVLAMLVAATTADAAGRELIRLDDTGVMRWIADNREVALFGANYCLPSSSDYRAAGYLGADRKKMIEQDMAHFARMSWDGLRLAIWGDWENCDREGNLIANDHLDLFDYLIHCAKQRGISMLLTPIHRHSALWPDGKDSDVVQGFSKYYPVAELGTNPAAIAAQQNYIRQLLAHVNPYTGTAIKDEPAIVFIELINEPHHHADDIRGSIRYINALVEAVRSTGCEKILFHNLSQDFRILPAITGSKAQGFSFGWYPTALGAQRTLTENYLRWVDHYTPLLENLPAMPRIVYEFDSADIVAGTMYPAMIRACREVGAQFAAMFAYDMLATAPFNLGWQTHYLNLIHSPNKAVSAIIAAEAMRQLPRGRSYGSYPHNCSFGPFRVSYEEDLSEMVTDSQFLHSNSTRSTPPQPEKLHQVIGVGGSPLVRYEGRGSYFLDRLAPGRWRLEVYPDAVLVQDPFAQRLNFKTVSSRLVWREWPMHLDLPDLGSAFTVRALNDGNAHETRALDGSFTIRPGVYLLTRNEPVSTEPLPVSVGRVGLREFVCPSAADQPPQVVASFGSEHESGVDWPVNVDVIDETAPRTVTLHVHSANSTRQFPMRPMSGYTYHTDVSADAVVVGPVEFSVVVATAEGNFTFPERPMPAWQALVVEPRAPLRLLDAGRDAWRVFTLRHSGGRSDGYLQRIPASANDPAVLRLFAPAAHSRVPNAFSLPIKRAIAKPAARLAEAKSIRLFARGNGPIVLTLVESDGTAWSAPATIDSSDWQSVEIPLTAFALSPALKLPLGYPGDWNSELRPAADRGHADDRLRLPRVEHLQVTASVSNAPTNPGESTIDIRNVELTFQ